MAVSYTKVYEDSTSVPSGSANTYDVANPLPAGLIEAVGVRWSGTTAAANMALGDQGELVSALRMTLNGDQWLNFNPLGGNNDQILSTSRMGAIVLKAKDLNLLAYPKTAGLNFTSDILRVMWL